MPARKDNKIAGNSHDNPTGAATDTIPISEYREYRLLLTLERLLTIEALDVRTALNEASDMVARAVHADKVDIFLHDVAINSLVAMGVSLTPLAKRQKELGLDRVPIANGGRSVGVYLTKESYMTGRADQDPEELPGVKGALAIRSIISVPLYVAGNLRGVVQVDSQEIDVFTQNDLRFMEAVAGWIGTITHRAELIEKIRYETEEEAKRAAGEELVTIIAHDLGNYLTPMKGRIDLIRRAAKKNGHDSYLRDADAIARVIDRFQRMVQDLMDVGRLGQDLFQLSRQPVDLVDLVQQTADALSTPQNTVTVQHFEEIHAEVDPDRMRQAVENLLANAIKHSPQGAPVTVVVNTEKRDDGDWVTIAVVDQGPGISPQLMPKLFTRFTPGPNSSGLGLGLYLAQSIARAHGGTLVAKSEPGKGATFCLSLPLSRIGLT